MNTQLKLSMKLYLRLFKVTCVGVLLATSTLLQAQVSNPVADASIKAFNDAFLVTSGGKTYYKKALNKNEDDGTWTLALDIFGMQDTYERTGSAEHKALVNNLCNSFLVINPTPYDWDGWNDDIAWMGLGLARGYQITGTPNLLTQAEYCFNLAYDRGWNTTFNNGGIWEQQPDMTPADGSVNKEALSNNPNGKLACILYESTGNVYYKNKAIQIYNWSRSHIFNPANGQVYAGVDRADFVNKGTAVYNQGSFIDFTAHLYKITGDEIILRDAQMAANYVINNMTTNGVISNSAGYLNTWADEYARGLGHLCMWNPQLWNTYYAFMKKNADAAWSSRRTDLNIAWNGWAEPTLINADDGPTKFVSTVAMQQFTPTVQSVLGTIEAEDYNFMKGIVIENITAGGKSAGSIEAGDWLEYIINVPSTGAYTISFNVATQNAASMEFQQNNVALTTINLPSTGNLQTYTDVSSSVKLIAGIQSIKLKAISGGWNINKLVVQSCGLIVPAVSVNGNTEQAITSITLNTGDDLLFNPQPSNGTWSWTGPNNFSSNSRAITINNILISQGGAYTAKYTSPTGCISIQEFIVTLTGCASTPIATTVQVNGGDVQQVNSITLEAGSYLTINTTPTDGTYSWLGPNGFASQSKEISFLNIDYKSAGDYNLTYINPNGCKSTHKITVALTGSDPCSTPITPYINVNDVSWQKIAYGVLDVGGKFTLGPQPLDAGTWSWTGPNGFTASTREFTIVNFSADKAGHYSASFTNAAECVSTLDFIIGLKGNCSTSPIVPEIKLDGIDWLNKDSISVASGGNVSITYPDATGLWSWIGPNGFTSSSSQILLDKILFWKKGKYVISFIDANACINSDTIDIDVLGDDYCGDPIIPYASINNGTWENTSSASLNTGDKFMIGPHPAKNMWYWTGPSGFTANTREITFDSFNTNQAGTYNATYTNTLGCLSFYDFTIKANEVITGISDKELKLTLYPNPTSDWITLSNVPSNCTITIFDLYGQLLITKKSESLNSDITLDVSNLKSSIYLIKIGNAKTLKFFKR